MNLYLNRAKGQLQDVAWLLLCYKSGYTFVTAQYRYKEKESEIHEDSNM